MKLGIIGLDSSHAVEFTRILNGKDQPFHIPGHHVVAAFPGDISYDFDFSCKRMELFTNQVRDDWGVKLYQDIASVMDVADAVFLEQVDARKRVKQFGEIASYGKPVFVDKPFALSAKECSKMKQVAEQFGTKVLSTSSLRFADALSEAISLCHGKRITGADFYGPMPLINSQPGYFWYGVHMADMLYRVMGMGCMKVSAVHTETHDVVTGVWRDGRIGTIRGNREGNPLFGGTVFCGKDVLFVDVSKDKRGFYECLVEQIISMFDTGISPVALEETEEVTRFLEAANESMATGKSVGLL